MVQHLPPRQGWLARITLVVFSFVLLVDIAVMVKGQEAVDEDYYDHEDLWVEDFYEYDEDYDHETVWDEDFYDDKKDDGNRHRSLAPTTGTSTVLMVRVTDAEGREPMQSASELTDKFFYDEPCVATQYLACSKGPTSDGLNLIPGTQEHLDNFSPGTGAVIEGGVLELTIPNVIQNVDVKEVEKWVTNEIKDQFNWSVDEPFTHVMYILPMRFNPYAPMPGFLSVHGDPDYATRINSASHELGKHKQQCLWKPQIKASHLLLFLLLVRAQHGLGSLVDGR